MKIALLTAPVALSWTAVSTATPPALPCTSDYKWPGGAIATAIGTGNIEKLAEWSGPDTTVVNSGREVARGREAVAKILKDNYSASIGPLRFMALDNAILATFSYTMKWKTLGGKAADYQTGGALLLRCKEPGTIEQIELMSRPNGMAEELLDAAAKEANG